MHSVKIIGLTECPCCFLHPAQCGRRILHAVSIRPKMECIKMVTEYKMNAQDSFEFHFHDDEELGCKRAHTTDRDRAARLCLADNPITSQFSRPLPVHYYNRYNI